MREMRRNEIDENRQFALAFSRSILERLGLENQIGNGINVASYENKKTPTTPAILLKDRRLESMVTEKMGRLLLAKVEGEEGIFLLINRYGMRQ